MESLFVVKSADGRGRLSDRKVAYSDRIRQNLVPVFALKKTPEGVFSLNCRWPGSTKRP